MGVRAFRWWRVTPEGVLTSVYQETRWEQPVLTASFVPRESYAGKIVRIVPYEVLKAEWGNPFPEPTTNEGERHYREQPIVEVALPPPPHPFPTKLEYGYHINGQQIGDIVPIADPAGIYALREETPLAGPVFWYAVVSGWVSLFGHIVEHEKGYRAEKALVCGPLTLWGENAELAQRVANRYECEVEAKEALNEYKRLDWSVLYGTGQTNPGV